MVCFGTYFISLFKTTPTPLKVTGEGMAGGFNGTVIFKGKFLEYTNEFIFWLSKDKTSKFEESTTLV